MEIRKRSTKALARRHDLNYFKKGSPLRRWQWMLTLIALAVSAAWLIGSYAWRGPQLLSKGPISASHSVFGAKCEACHVPVAAGLFHRAGFQKHVPDSACQGCHAVPAHQSSAALAGQLSSPQSGLQCSTCHVEHTGSMALAHTSNTNCTQCHANLNSTLYATGIHSFMKGHPEFAVLRAGPAHDGGIKFSHAAHLQRNLLGPSGRVDMECGDCHRAQAGVDGMPWRFGSAHLQQTSTQLQPSQLQLGPIRPIDARAYMAPSTYAETCHDCHTLKFDRHIDEEAPHASTVEIRNYIGDKLSAYAAGHPEVVTAEIRDWGREQAAMVPGQRIYPAPHNPAEWIAVRRLQAERRLWHQSCNLCHNMEIADDSDAFSSASSSAAMRQAGLSPGGAATFAKVPSIAPVQIKMRWLSNAVFSHQAHRAVSCESCHAATRASRDSADILLPGIATCQQCHDGRSNPQGPALAAGHVESGCYLCHTYHNAKYPLAFKSGPPNLRLEEIGSLQPMQ